MNKLGIIVPVSAFPAAWQGRKARPFGMWGRLELEVWDGKKLKDLITIPLKGAAMAGPKKCVDALAALAAKQGCPAHSFLQNYARLVRGFINGDSPVNESLTDSGGVARQARIVSGTLTGDNVPPVGAAGDIGFGNSNAALDSTQHELQGVILGKAAVVTTVIVEDATQSQWKHEGQVTNTTGGTFNVQEIGLYANMRDAIVGGAPVRQIMTMRDIVNPLVAVGDTLTVLGRYTFTVAI